MRHRNTTKKLDRKKDPREAMLNNMAVSIILFEKIKTTEAKAKVVKPLLEKMITRSKVKSVHNKQLLGRHLPDKKAVQKLLDVLGPRYKDRKGGYCRIIKIGPRLGDGAKMAQIELV